VVCTGLAAIGLQDYMSNLIDEQRSFSVLGIYIGAKVLPKCLHG